MLTWMGIILTVGFVALLAKSAMRTSGVAVGTTQARESGELGTLIEAIETTPFAEQATQWDQAIGELWQSYARDEAARLVVEAAKRNDADVIQYWIKQVIEVEPEIASEHFDEEFMAEYFQPEVAAKCGRGGCCG
jgi:hypothetical protein